MLNRIPFTAEEFFGVFSAYNRAVWPAQLVLIALAITLAWLALRPGDRFTRFIWLGLAGLWLWSGVAYHALYFSAINPLAFGFAMLFVVQAFLFARPANHNLTFRFSRTTSGITGALLQLYALAIYPIMALLMGEHYPAMPTFGAPCPVAIYTFGLLLWTREPLPLHFLIIPALWALAGSFAAAAFGVVQDVALPIAALAALGMLYARSRQALHPREAELRPTH